jgi:hypothetical protein
VNLDPDGELDNMTFTIGSNAHHAIEFGLTSPLTMTLQSPVMTGFNASNGQNDSTFHVKRTSGTVTINIIGGTGNFSYRTDGATVVIAATVALKVTMTNDNNDAQQGVNVRYEESDGTVIGQGTTDSSGVFSFSIDVADLPLTGARIIARKVEFEFIEPTVNIPAAGFDIPFTLQAEDSAYVA